MRLNHTLWMPVLDNIKSLLTQKGCENTEALLPSCLDLANANLLSHFRAH